jgi:hypothetical protein
MWMKKQLPQIDPLADFFLPMKFYWARAHQRKPRTEMAFTGGIFSKIGHANGLQPLFADFDWTSLAEVEKAVRELQQKWKLGDAFIYASVESSFHAKFYYDWLPFEKIIAILESNPAIDEGFVEIAKKIGGCVLRTCAKPERPAPKFVEVIESEFQRNKSGAEKDWGDLLRMSVEALLGMKLNRLMDFRGGALLERAARES